jgi:hypothetical protein
LDKDAFCIDINKLGTVKKINMAKQTNKRDSKKEKSCFIIMPFGGWFDTYYEDIYIPAINDAEMKPTRADDLYRPGNIVNDIWNYTKSADIIIADLTSKNPNVFYELGLAHAITKPAVLITASMDDVPFDLRSLRVIVYDKNIPNWGDKLKDKITKALIETLKSPEDAIPPTFLETTKSKRIEVSPEEKEILELKSDIDSLRREVRSRNRLTREMDEIDPDEAIERIKMYLKKGMPNRLIAQRLKPYGPPIEWTLDEIKRLKEK